MRYNKRRLSNRYALSVRHNDGLQEIALKAKAKAKELYEKLKEAKSSGKLLIVIKNIISALHAIGTGASIANVNSNIKDLKYWKESLSSGLSSADEALKNISTAERKIVVNSILSLIGTIGIVIKISNKVTKKDSYYVRYKDGIKDIALKIKSKIKEAIDSFKQMPNGKKVAFILSRLAAVVTSVLMIKSSIDAKAKIKELKELKDMLIDYSADVTGFEGGKTNREFEKTYSKEMLKSKLKPVIMGIGLLISLLAARATKDSSTCRMTRYDAMHWVRSRKRLNDDVKSFALKGQKITNKLIAKIKSGIKKHPYLSRVIALLLEIDGIMRSTLAGVGTFGLITGNKIREELIGVREKYPWSNQIKLLIAGLIGILETLASELVKETAKKHH